MMVGLHDGGGDLVCVCVCGFFGVFFILGGGCGLGCMMVGLHDGGGFVL